MRRYGAAGGIRAGEQLCMLRGALRLAPGRSADRDERCCPRISTRRSRAHVIVLISCPSRCCCTQSNIRSEGFRSLREGEPVEFEVEAGTDGRAKAINVTGPEGQAPQVRQHACRDSSSSSLSSSAGGRLGSERTFVGSGPADLYIT